VLFGASLAGQALINASQTATNYFHTKKYSRTKTLSVHKYAMFVFAQLLRNWCDSGLATRVTTT
jgi:hypothetical protein